MAAGGSPRRRAGCRVPGVVMVRVLSRGLPLRADPQVSPRTRVGVLSLSPSRGQRGVRGVAGTRAIQLTHCHPSPSFLCPSVLPSSPSSLSSLSPCPALSCVHGQEGPCQRGPASVSWQRQRLAAPAASAVSPGFLCGAEGRAGQPHTDWPLAGFGEERPWGAASCLSFPPLPPGASLNFHGSFLPKPLMCLDVSWRKHGGRGAVRLRAGTPLGEGRARGCQASVHWCVEAGGPAWTPVWLLSCIAGVCAPLCLRTQWMPAPL